MLEKSCLNLQQVNLYMNSKNQFKLVLALSFDWGELWSSLMLLILHTVELRAIKTDLLATHLIND